MKRWQIGISQISWPYRVNWQEDFVEAETEGAAEDLALDKGYYRNLRLRLA